MNMEKVRSNKNKSTTSSLKKVNMSNKNYAKTAIGVNTFKKLVEESTIFVDKSLLIKEFVENSAEVLLVTCPRRWGKSINMDMIKTFLEIEVDSDGNKYSDKTKTHNYKIFQGKMNPSNERIESLKKPLAIAKDENFVKKYQGEHPVKVNIKK
jgi:predicted hydrocarbon binding protein